MFASLSVLALAVASVAANFTSIPFNASCSSSAASFVLTEVAADPLTPSPGTNVTIRMSGTNSVALTRNATASVKVKSPIGLVKTFEYNLCDYSELAGIPCPIPAGEQSLTIIQPLSILFPTGKYSISGTATNGDGSELLCFSGTTVTLVRA
ncbi:hypothetical protein HDU91_006111 [Kappamyces sp. JEL0680]|nr:hypothetical protein HDU91_006111 [Kappamyces sp. JEL0680]